MQEIDPNKIATAKGKSASRHSYFFSWQFLYFIFRSCFETRQVQVHSRACHHIVFHLVIVSWLRVGMQIRLFLGYVITLYYKLNNLRSLSVNH